MARDRVLVFDVNETLLDLAALDPHFERVFGDARVRREWFGLMLQSALLFTVTGPYVDFGSHFRTALHQTAERHRVTLAEADEQAILRGVRELPAHPEVKESLGRLRAAGFRLAALTNSTQAVEEAQLRAAGLHGLFDHELSADSARRLKPAREAYETAARLLDVPIARVRMIAAHAWDVAGAQAAGAAAAFVARPGMLWNPLVPRPDIWGADLREVADAIIARDS